MTFKPAFALRQIRSLARVAVAALVGACVLGAPSAHAQTLTKIIVGGQITDDTTPILYALKAGLFKRAGLDVDLQKTTNGGTAIPAVLGGAFNIADANILNLAVANNKGIPLELVAPGIVYNGTTEFFAAVVKKGSALKSGRDLNGKIIGVSTIGDLNAIALSDWMDQNGGDSKSIKEVEIAWSDVAPALEAGRIDLGTLVQPILSQALASGKVQIFGKTGDAIATRFLITGWMAKRDWAAANADAVRRFARVVRDAQIYCNAHKAETAPLLSAYTGADEQLLLHSGRATYAANFADPRDMQPVVAAAYKYGAVPKIFAAENLVSPAVRGLTVSNVPGR
jgi:NitT/TauT family transport system substrate-binding protein